MHWFGQALLAAGLGVLAGLVITMLVCHALLGLGILHTIPYVALLLTPPCGITALAFALLTHRSNPDALMEQETRCRKCGYILRGISEPRCPECGERI